MGLYKGRNPLLRAVSGLFKRRGWDLNPRATFRPPAVFKTAPFDRSGTPPYFIVAAGAGLCPAQARDGRRLRG